MLFKVIKPCYMVKMLCGQCFTLLLTIGLSLFSLCFQTARRMRVSWWRSRACWWRSWRWWRKETNWWVCWTSNGWRRKPRTEIWRAWSSPEAISSTGPELLTLDEELLEWPARRTTLDWESHIWRSASGSWTNACLTECCLVCSWKEINPEPNTCLFINWKWWMLDFKTQVAQPQRWEDWLQMIFTLVQWYFYT